MSVSALSTAGFSQYIAASSDISASQQAFNSLQQNLASGNLSGALSAFNAYQRINQSPTSTSSSSTSSASITDATQTASDMTTLGSALSSGNLGKAQSAFTTVQADLQTSPSQAMANATAAAAQTVQWIDDMLSLSSPDAPNTTATTADLTSSILDAIHGLTPSSTTTDPTTTLLNNAYGTGSTASSTSTSASSTSTATSTAPTTGSSTTAASSYASQGNLGSGASVNAFA